MTTDAITKETNSTTTEQSQKELQPKEPTCIADAKVILSIMLSVFLQTITSTAKCLVCILGNLSLLVAECVAAVVIVGVMLILALINAAYLCIKKLGVV